MNKRENDSKTTENTPDATIWKFLTPPEDETKQEPKKENRKTEPEEERAPPKEAKAEPKKPEKKETPEEQPEEDEDARQRAFRRSKRLVRQLSEREHSELDSVELIQLIVAERITWLGARLYGDEDLDEESLDTIEYQFDFLSALADKLVDPEIQADPEVEEVYRQITQDEPSSDSASTQPAAALSVHVETNQDELLEVIVHTPEVERILSVDSDSSEQAAADARDSHVASHGASIAFVVTSLAAACRHSRHQSGAADRPGAEVVPATVHHESGDYSPERVDDTSFTPHSITALPTSTATAADLHSMPIAPQQNNRSATLPAPLSTAPSVASEAFEPLRHELASEPQRRGPVFERPLEAESHSKASRLSTPPVTTALLPSTPSPTPFAPDGRERHTGVVEATSQRVPLPSSIDRSQSQPAASPTSERLYVERISAPAHSESAAPEGPVEDWSMSDILKVARTIPIGGGRYLQNAFERGEIDRDGLVKVVKDWKKGRPYVPTLEKQRAQLVNQRTQSIERLRSSHNEDATKSTDAPLAKHEEAGQEAAQQLGTELVQAAASAQQPHSSPSVNTPPLLPSAPEHNKDRVNIVVSVLVVAVLSVVCWVIYTFYKG